jgi:hypothetical protein
MSAETIDRWLKTSPLLSGFCSQNGWIDNDTLRYEVRSRDDHRLRVNVYFTEVIMEGSGCVADRVERFGQVDLKVDDHDKVVDAQIA